MKTIEEPTPDFQPWWAGKRATCGSCNRTIELEADDFTNWRGIATDEKVQIKCPTFHCPAYFVILK